ncbi:MAG: thioredoxin fold domain-containing protein [Bacteroidales bacterium]|nr:thioredoxin fold domain-containing protein [Bacteroidales bacterium]
MKKALITLVTVFVCLTSNIAFGQDVKDVEIVHLTKEMFLKEIWNYEKNPQEFIYEGKKPCIIDFYASWCGPCRMFSTTLQQIANEYKGKVICYKVNTEEQKELSAIFGVRSIPAILFVPKKGKPQMGMGNLPKETVIQAINEVLLTENKK